jgi:hypothetical protein
VAAAATKILQQKLAALKNELEAATQAASADVAAAVAAAIERERKTMDDTLQQVQTAHLRTSLADTHWVRSARTPHGYSTHTWHAKQPYHTSGTHAVRIVHAKLTNHTHITHKAHAQNTANKWSKDPIRSWRLALLGCVVLLQFFAHGTVGAAPLSRHCRHGGSEFRCLLAPRSNGAGVAFERHTLIAFFGGRVAPCNFDSVTRRTATVRDGALATQSEG